MSPVDVPRFDARDRGVDVGVFADLPFPATGVYRMYHGTTVKSAERIEAEGFRAPDFDGIVSAVAGEAGVPVGKLRDSLALGSFAYGREQVREEDVFFTDSPLWAVDWAMWGGEAHMEAWAAVYRMRNPEVPAMSAEAQEWAVDSIGASPAVMAFDIPYVALEAAENSGLRPDELKIPWDTNSYGVASSSRT